MQTLPETDQIFCNEAAALVEVATTLLTQVHELAENKALDFCVAPLQQIALQLGSLAAPLRQAAVAEVPAEGFRHVLRSAVFAASARQLLQLSVEARDKALDV